MNQDEYDRVEAPAIEQLKQLGWQYIHGSDLSPEQTSPEISIERSYFRDVVLINRLESAIKRINPWISEENLRKVSRELTHPRVATLMEANHHIYQTLVN